MTARAGRYPSTLLQGMSPERLSRFFVEGSDGSYTVSKQVRGVCMFSEHSLTRDPPLSRIDLVSCRNLLIYLDTELQAGVLPAFHYSLVPDGILLLGSSETVSRHEGLFATLDRDHRIFQRRNVPSPALRLFGKSGAQASPSQGVLPAKAGRVRGGPEKTTNRVAALILDRFAPAFVVVAADGAVVEFSSRVGRYLEPAPGLPNQNVLSMARPGLGAHLRTALQQAVETGRSVEESGILIAGEGVRRITLAVEPLPEQGANTLYLVVFVEAGQQAGEVKAEPAASVASDSHLDTSIEVELRDTREQPPAITKEHQAAVEELLSVNEELQSTNEELKASKEETQSINEELEAVNSQLARKVDELHGKNIDLKNLFESTQVATIFLDTCLVVRNFTPAVANIYNLIPSDVGRPMTDIVGQLRYTGLQDDVRHALATLEPLERRITREDGTAHYLIKILPYRNPDSTVDGALVTFVDVTSIVLAEQHQRLLIDELNHRVKNMLTVVISLATQTMHGSKTMDEFSSNYMGRIYALTAVYSLLSNTNWQAVSLRDIVLEELRPFLAKDRTNFVVSGPPIPLEPRAAPAFGMGVHELTTNAVRYGALSILEGNVNVTWRIEQDPDGDQLVVDWIEKDGPPVVVPTHRGFGMTLIERGLKQDMAALVQVKFAVEGVRATLKAPMRAVEAIEAAEAFGA